MQTIIVAKEFDRITAETTGETIKVEFESKQWQHVFVRHISGEIICGLSDKISGSANGVTKIKSGGARFDPPVPVVYIGGVGVCEIIVSNISAFPFSSSAEGGEENSQQYYWTKRVQLKSNTKMWVEIPSDATGNTIWVSNQTNGDVYCGDSSGIPNVTDGTVIIPKEMEFAYSIYNGDKRIDGLYLLANNDGFVTLIIVPGIKNPLNDDSGDAPWIKSLYNS